MNKITGYKVANSNGTCRGFQFEVGKKYKHQGDISLCNEGFHFCVKPSHCFNYYSFDSNNKVYEISATGKIIHGDDKSVTNNIHIVREIEWSEVLKLVNEGKDNTGHSNTGNSNTGYSNTGNSNTGYSNTGYSNTGNSNTGNRNTGNSNTGNRNTGNWNTGYSNTGNSNTGNRNTGDWNTGYSNTGYSNMGNRNTGLFCTGDAPFPLFNKESSWTECDFKNSRVYELFCQVDTKMWVNSEYMNEDEKQKNPQHATCGGYLKDIPFKEAFQDKWHNWSEANRNEFKNLPNFDAAIFEEITGVNVNQ